ncbi:MAG: hypothetical protein WAK33_25855 [Silvibacterium sp.]
MAERVDFCKGLFTGTLVGIAVAAYARGDLKRLLSFECSSEPRASEPEAYLHRHTERFNLRREASENAGDPTRLSPDLAARSGLQSVSIDRPGGAPGGTVAHEVLEVPGHPGQPLDHSDSSQAVRSASRTHNFSASRN